jgi:arylsulfatase A-like enzyme
VLPKLTQAAIDYIAQREADSQPFFLYIPWNSPHSPVVPSPKWVGKSGLNQHADFVMQTDDSFGRVVQALKDRELLENTLIICSCDNGTSAPTSKKQELEALGHYPSGDLRGSKADIWDGGHRVPFLVSWPEVVTAGSRCEQLVCLTDVMRTVADVLDVALPDNAAEDSYSILPALRGQSSHARKNVIHHSISGYFSIRSGPWKLALCPGSGGWTKPKPTAKNWGEAKDAGLPLIQLVNMTADIGEQTNLASQNSDKVQELRELLEEQIAAGRSTPGPSQPNDVSITIDKRPKQQKKTG